MHVFKGLQQSDLTRIEEFFDEMKRIAEKLKKSAIENYKQNQVKIVSKIYEKDKILDNNLLNYSSA